MQAVIQPSSGLPTVLRFGGRIANVKDDLKVIAEQFDLGGRARFDRLPRLEVKLGRETTAGDLANLRTFIWTRSFVPQWDVVSITADAVVWTPEMRREIQHLFSRYPVTVVTIYNSQSEIQSTELHYVVHDYPPLAASFVVVPVDRLLQAQDLSNIFGLPNLQTLILLPPSSALTFRTHKRTITRALVQALPTATSLKKVTVTLDFLFDIRYIIEALKDIRGFAILELLRPSLYNIQELELSDQYRLENALLRSLEPFPGLQRLIIDRTVVSDPLRLLFAMGARMFQEDPFLSADREAVVFQSPLPLLF